MTKARESGMPEESLWTTFFKPDELLRKIGLRPGCRSAVDIGCGYGTFTIAAARMVRGKVYALDIDPEMVRETVAKAKAADLSNVEAIQRDFIAEGSGLADASADYLMLFNILHAEDPLVLLRESFRILSPGGLLGIIHWNYDPATPRGPNMDIRPRPGQCQAWAEQAGFRLSGPELIDLPPYHYGLVLVRPLS
jgi:ubiquinone/menaquinone biosynthesis C-methylase UbiE